MSVVRSERDSCTKGEHKLGCGDIQTLVMRGTRKHPEVDQATFFLVLVLQSLGDRR